METIKNYSENLFVYGGYWHKKRKAKGRDYIQKVIRDKNSVVKNYIIPLWGDISPQDLTVKKIDHKLCVMEDIAPATKNKILTCLSEIFTHLIEEEIYDKNPIRNVIYHSGQKFKRGILSPEEMQILFPTNRADLLKIWPSQVYATAFLVLKDTGLRSGELRALQWKDWDRDLGFFPITKAIEASTRTKIKGTKTGQTKPAIVSEFTAEQIEILKSERLFTYPTDFIFLSQYGMPISSSILSLRFREGVKRAGINKPEITPHWLRHTFNTRSLEELPVEVVQTLMGHKTVRMLQRYRHADETSLRRDAEKIIRLYGNRKNYRITYNLPEN